MFAFSYTGMSGVALPAVVRMYQLCENNLPLTLAGKPRVLRNKVLSGIDYVSIN